MGGIITVTTKCFYKRKEKILRLKGNFREILDKVEKIQFYFSEKLNQENFTVAKILQIPTFSRTCLINCDVMWMFGALQASVPQVGMRL